MGLRAPLSKFVTNTSWTLIAVSAFGLLVTAIQLFVFVVFFPSPETRVPATSNQPGAEWMLSHLGMILGVMLVVNLVAFASSVGLLRRQRWAYFLILAFCYVGAVMSAGAILSLPMLGVAPGALILPTLLNAGLVWINLWVAKRLRTPMIAQEFHS